MIKYMCYVMYLQCLLAILTIYQDLIDFMVLLNAHYVVCILVIAFISSNVYNVYIYLHDISYGLRKRFDVFNIYICCKLCVLIEGICIRCCGLNCNVRVHAICAMQAMHTHQVCSHYNLCSKKKLNINNIY